MWIGTLILSLTVSNPSPPPACSGVDDGWVARPQIQQILEDAAAHVKHFRLKYAKALERWKAIEGELQQLEKQSADLQKELEKVVPELAKPGKP